MSSEITVVSPDAGTARAPSLNGVKRVQPYRTPVALSRRWVLTLLSSDVLAFLLSAYLGIGIVQHTNRLARGLPTLVSAAEIIVLQLLLFRWLGLYRRTFALSTRDEIYLVSVALAIGASPLLVAFTIVPAHSTSRLVILVSLGFSLLFVGTCRAVLHELHTISAARRPRRIAIVGRPDRTAAVAESLGLGAGNRVLRIPVDDLDASVVPLHRDGALDLGQVAWFARARTWNCELLLLTEMLPPAILPVVLEVAGREHIKVAFAPPRFQVHAYSIGLEVDGEQALIVPKQLRACTRPARIMKRAMDLIVSAVALALAAPVLLLGALALKLESGGPVLFRQSRVGFDGRVFDVLKLRSMGVDAERATGPVWALRDDPRVTRVGRLLRRFSIDELPQLVNVLRGDMSLVGPRPERPEFVSQFRELIPRYDERHLVRPGITGWSQVNLRRALQPSDAGRKLSYDLFYIERWSPFLDLYIVVKTAMEFLFHKAA